LTAERRHQGGLNGDLQRVFDEAAFANVGGDTVELGDLAQLAHTGLDVRE
jgi:hypothetical protein